MNVFLLFLSILPAILIIYFVGKFDVNKEPKKMLISLFFFGILSTIIVLIFSIIISMFFSSAFLYDLDSMFIVFWKVLIFIALVEEMSKWFFIYIKTFNHPEFDEFYDMIVYSIFLSMGFATVENIMYIFTAESALQTGIIRFLLSVPGHACYAVFMGYYLGLAKVNYYRNNTSEYRKCLLLSILIPTLIHGVFDFCLFSKSIFFIFVFLIFVVLLYVITLKKVKKVVGNNFLVSKVNLYCTNCGKEANNNKFCTNCGNEINKTI